MKKDEMYNKLNEAIMSLISQAKNVLIIKSETDSIISFEVKLSRPMYDLSCIKIEGVKYNVEHVADKSLLFYREGYYKNQTSRILYLTGSFLREHSDEEIHEYIKHFPRYA